MHVQPSLTETTRSRSSRSAEGTRLHGRWLVIARVVWVAVVVFTLSIFLLSLPAYFAQLQTVCAGVTCVYSYGQLTPGTAQALQNLGLSIGGYAVSTLALAIASALVSFGVASVLFWRRSADWMAMFVSLFLVTFGVNFSVQAQAILATNVQTAWYWSLNILIGLGWVSLILLLYLFPDGRFVPRWTRPLAVFVVASNIFLDASPGAHLHVPSLGAQCHLPDQWRFRRCRANLPLRSRFRPGAATANQVGGVRLSSDNAGDSWQIRAAADLPLTQRLELTLFLALYVCLSAWLTAHSTDAWHRHPALPAVGYRHPDQSYAGLWYLDGSPRPGLLWPDHRAASALQSDHWTGRSIPVGDCHLDTGHCCALPTAYGIVSRRSSIVVSTAASTMPPVRWLPSVPPCGMK